MAARARLDNGHYQLSSETVLSPALEPPADLPAVLLEPDSDEIRWLGLAEVFIAGRQSPHTRVGYRRDLTGCRYSPGECPGLIKGHRHDPLAYLPWISTHALKVPTVRRAQILIWLRVLSDAGRSEATRARALASVGSWYKWLIREEQLERDPTLLDPKERPHVDADFSATGVMSAKEVDQLLEAAHLESPRALAIVALLYTTGIRVAELCDAALEDIWYDRGTPMLQIHGKGRRRRTAPLPPSTFGAIQAYLQQRPDMERLPALEAGSKPRRLLFTTRTGRPLDQPAVFKLLRRLARKAGLKHLEDSISPHVLRHTFGTLSLEERPLWEVQDALGHADSRTTRRYHHAQLTAERHPAFLLASKVHMPNVGQPEPSSSDHDLED